MGPAPTVTLWTLPEPRKGVREAWTVERWLRAARFPDQQTLEQIDFETLERRLLRLGPRVRRREADHGSPRQVSHHAHILATKGSSYRTRLRKSTSGIPIARRRNGAQQHRC